MLTGFSSIAQITNPIPEVVRWSDITILIEPYVQIPASSAGFPRTRIVQLKPAGDGSGRLFVNDLNGKMHLVSQGSASLYLDLGSEFANFKNAPGLGTGFTSFAFHPDFASNGRLYTSHTEAPNSGPSDFTLPDPSDSVALQGVITEWTATDPSADVFAGTSREVLRVDLSGTIHGMQAIEFNPSATAGSADYGMLYICIGDGQSTISGFPQNTSRLDSHQGTIFRIAPAGTNSGNGRYGVPDDNPFASDADPDTYGEIWAYGFRNPHRITWDTGGDHVMLSGDIGERNVEEVNLIEPGRHYGWNVREGTFVINPEFANNPGAGTNYDLFPLPENDATLGYTYPVAQYDHDEGAAIAGGYVYRGSLAPHLVGKYIFGDITDGILYFVEVDALSLGSQAPIRKLRIKLDGVPASMMSIIGRSRTDIRFGYDEDNEIYITEKQNGMVYRVVGSEQPPPPSTSDAEFDNISTRGVVGNGPDRLIAGFVVRGVPGATTGTVLVRAIGPGLMSVGVTSGYLEDPVLEIYSADDPTTPVYSNDDWGDSEDAADIKSVSETIGAFALADDSTDAVLMLSLPSGVYTAKVGGKDNGTGIAIVEVYAVD
ncbi:MAG: PQQ-dependent sugar dehydrogenase [Opitutaceae bacterium]